MRPFAHRAKKWTRFCASNDAPFKGLSIGSIPKVVPTFGSGARGSAALISAALALGGLVGPALAAPYDFVPAPQTDLNRIYRIDRITGEVSSCQYGLQEGTIGVTLCFSAGDGAGPQTPGEYGLVASRHEREGRHLPGQLPHRPDEHLLRLRRAGGVHAPDDPFGRHILSGGAGRYAERQSRYGGLAAASLIVDIMASGTGRA